MAIPSDLKKTNYLQMKIKDLISKLLVIIIFEVLVQSLAYGQQELKNNSESRKILLPDRTELEIWSPDGKYSHTYIVDQQHPKSSDVNPGTVELPFKTINKAANLLKPGERVIVKEGVYREWVIPQRGGESPEKMISYEAAPGEKVIIKGSEVIDHLLWRKNKSKPLGPLKRFLQMEVDTTISIWSAKLPRSFFNGYNPFAMINRNQLAQEVPRRVNPKSPNSFSNEDLVTTLLKRGLVFQNGRRLKQVSHTGYMYKEDGTFWVESNGLEIYVRPFGDIKPSEALFEVTAREFIFAPEKFNLGFIKVAGFQMEHAGNAWPLPNSGAFSTMGGNHWVIENNKISQVNAIGIDIGAHLESIEYQYAPEYHIVRGNEISECGLIGLAGTGVRFSLVEENHVHHCSWHLIEQNFENAGIKMHQTLGTVIRRNKVHDIYEGSGIWLDSDIRNTRVCQNLIYNIESVWGGIFFEMARYTPNLIDNNIVLNIKGNGIYEHDCDRLIISHNLVSNCSETGILLKRGDPNRMDNLRGSTSRKHKVFNNIINDTGWFIDFDNVDNYSDHNLFGKSKNPGPLRISKNEDYLDLATWREFYQFDMNSTQAKITIGFNELSGELCYNIEGELPKCTNLEQINYDFFGNSRGNNSQYPGPFTHLDTGREIKLKLNRNH